MTAPATPRRERVWFAHAVRGPACLLVVLTHLADVFVLDHGAAAAVGRFPPVEGLPSVPWAGAQRFLASHDVALGALGVLLFFLVSGFVIPFSLEHGRLRGFAVRRFFRLYPTLWVCLAVTVTALVVQGAVLDVPFAYGTDVLAANGFLVAPYAERPWVEPVLWSLAVEELFYVVAALLGWRRLLGRRSALAAVAAVLATLAVATGDVTPGSPLFWLGFNAAFVNMILVGVVVHQLYRRRWPPADAAVMFVVVFGAYVVALRHGPTAVVSGVYTTSSIVAVVVFGALFAARDRLPYSRLLDGLSNISYPLYLLHGVNGYVVIRAVYTATGSYYAGLVAALAVTVVTATAVHLLVEAPTNNLGRRLARRRGTAGTPGPVEPPYVAVAGDLRS